jgi:hypothetical protein
LLRLLSDRKANVPCLLRCQRRPNQQAADRAGRLAGERHGRVPGQSQAVVLGCWSATLVTASITVMAARPSLAVAAAEVLLPNSPGPRARS